MNRYNTSFASTPSGAAGRRSTRSARGSAKRNRGEGSSRGRGGGVGGGGGGLKRKFEKAAERPAKKWVKIWRAPAANIRFQVAKWVQYEELTEEERIDLEAKREKEAGIKRQKESDEVEEGNERRGDVEVSLGKVETVKHEPSKITESISISVNDVPQPTYLVRENADMVTTDTWEEKNGPIDQNEVPAAGEDDVEPRAKRVRIDSMAEIVGDSETAAVGAAYEPASFSEHTQLDSQPTQET